MLGINKRQKLLLIQNICISVSFVAVYLMPFKTHCSENCAEERWPVLHSPAPGSKRKVQSACSRHLETSALSRAQKIVITRFWHNQFVIPKNPAPAISHLQCNYMI